MRSSQRTIALIGAGPVGTSLAIHAQRLGRRVVAVVARHGRTSQRLARRVKCRSYGTSVSIIPSDVDLVVIAVPDGEIARVAASLASTVSWRRRTAFVHCSGAVTSDALAPLRARGHRVASLHPIQTFPRAALRFADATLLQNIAWGVEAATGQRTWAERLVREWKGRPVRVPKEAKITYHLACTFAANYPVVLWQLTAELGRAARIPGGLGPFIPLILESLSYAYELGPKRALTGPAARGESSVLRKHREALRRLSPTWVPLFNALVHQARRRSR
ncbi:MAG: DUF2520 domain-containing protein [Bacteroidetes bacterium]|jgi:predicted short-subunit dehydrogenase-like oxidoreductase (DUF2520 family)|nr:DUF2520 domain-containing protein [Bacteroidota bacterium]